MADVWYVGQALIRTIYNHEWKSQGIPGASEVSWGPTNGWSVPESEFSEGQLLVLERDKDFRLGQDGPRLEPKPASQVDSLKSGYYYWASIMEIYGFVQGPTGPRGSAWFTGEGPPGSLPDSKVGDYYVDSLTGNYYELE